MASLAWAAALLAVGCAGPQDRASDASEAPVDCDAVEELASVYFVAGEAGLDAHDSRQRLDANAAVLLACPDLRVMVRAYVDDCTHVESGAPGVGLQISQARADTVATHYLRRGVDYDRVALAEGLGSDPRAGVLCQGPEARGRRSDTILLSPYRQWVHVDQRGVRPQPPVPDSVRIADSLWFSTRSLQSIPQRIHEMRQRPRD